MQHASMRVPSTSVPAHVCLGRFEHFIVGNFDFPDATVPSLAGPPRCVQAHQGPAEVVFGVLVRVAM
jgi:hypothetical protein